MNIRDLVVLDFTMHYKPNVTSLEVAQRKYSQLRVEVDDGVWYSVDGRRHPIGSRAENIRSKPAGVYNRTDIEDLDNMAKDITQIMVELMADK